MAVSTRDIVSAAAAGRRIPSYIRPVMEDILRDVRLPEAAGQRRGMLNACRRISIKMGIPELIDALNGVRRSEPNPLLEMRGLNYYTMQYCTILQFAMGSGVPADYLRFLARKDLNISAFYSSARIFADRRMPDFEEVPEDEGKFGDAIMSAWRSGSMDPLKGLLRPMLESLNRLQLGEIGMEDTDHAEIPDEIDKLRALLWHLTNDDGIGMEMLGAECPEEMERYNELIRLDESLGRDELFPEDLRDTFARDAFISFGIYPYQKKEQSRPGEPWRNALFRFRSHSTFGWINCYLITDTERYKRVSGAMGQVIGNDMLLIYKDGPLFQHELQHVFDNLVGIRKGPIVNEYRAHLAELAFSTNPVEALRAVMQARRAAQTTIDSWRRQALRRLFKECKGSGAELKFESLTFPELLDFIVNQKPIDNISAREKEMIPRIARDILNRTYKRECGLSYDEIVEPFRKG